jgi:DNA end-binding protein Ku
MATTRPSWEGHLTFNLVSIPVKAFNAVGATSGKIGFHLLHKGCNERIRYKKVCPVHGEVGNDDIVSGYEYQKGQYVTVEKDEKGELREKDDKAISIDTFVTPDAIDPIYFSGRTYYLVPNGPAAQKPYAVMFEAMRAHDRLAVARLVLSGRGHVAVVRPFGKLLGMTLLAFEDQVKAPAPFEAEVRPPAVSAKEKGLAEALLESATSDFDLHQYRDDYAERLAKLVQGKARRKLGKAGHAPAAATGDLMDALRKSLAQQGTAPRRRVRTATAPRRRAATAARGRARS